MKKKILLLTCLLPLLAGCSLSETFKPRRPYPGEDPVVKEEDMTIYFFLDNTHAYTDEEAIYKMRWYMLEPLGECPDEAVLTDANAPDPLYPKFIGYSEYPSSIDEDHIWNFATDYKQSNELRLYGIWVKE